MSLARSLAPLALTALCPLLFACEEGGQTEDAAPLEAERVGQEAAAAGAEHAPAANDAAEGAAQETQPARRFLEAKGTVTLDGEEAQIGTEIPETAEIVTGEDGYAVLTLAPGSIVEVRKGTRVKLGASERRSTSMRLYAGALWSVLASGSDFEVETNNAVAGVRGTVFYTEAQSEHKTYICACDGTVEITGKGKNKVQRTPSSEMGHKAFFMQSRGKKGRAKKAKRLNHTDEQKDALLAYLEQAK